MEKKTSLMNESNNRISRVVYFQPQFHLLGQTTWGYHPADDVQKNFVGKSWDELHLPNGSIAAALPPGQC